MDKEFAKFSCDFAESVNCGCKERQFRESEFRRDIAKLTPNSIWAIDRKRKFSFLSGSTENIFGAESTVSIGSEVDGYFDMADGSSFKKELDELYRNPQEVRDLRLKRKGSDQIILVSLLPYYDQSAKFLGFRGFAQNITSLLEIEDRVQESNLALKNKNIALNELLSRVETEKNEIYSTIATNVEKFIKPLLRSLQTGDNLTPVQKKTISTVEQHLNELNWNFYKNDDALELPLTPTERQLCRLVRANYCVKEIAQLQSISIETAKTHFKNIRKKLGLTNRKVRLANFFQQG